MPAVRTFSLYAGTAILINYILQITCFLAVLIWDSKRQESGRLEFCCWRKLPYEVATTESYMYSLFNNLYSPLLLKDYVRMTTVKFLVFFLHNQMPLLVGCFFDLAYHFYFCGRQNKIGLGPKNGRSRRLVCLFLL